jgi:hypothetical protein
MLAAENLAELRVLSLSGLEWMLLISQPRMSL